MQFCLNVACSQHYRSATTVRRDSMGNTYALNETPEQRYNGATRKLQLRRRTTYLTDLHRRPLSEEQILLDMFEIL